MATLSFPDHDLVLEDRENGVWVQQHGKTYLARKWRLTNQVVGIVKSAVANGLTCLWQDGHPGGDTSHHISFSFSHEKGSWIFVLGEEALPPSVRQITISKKVRLLFEGSEIIPFWESFGGKNLTIAPYEFPAFLDHIERKNLREIRTLHPETLSRGSPELVIGFQLEKDLQDRIAAALDRRTGKTRVQVSQWLQFNSSHYAKSKDIPDLIVATPDKTIIVELKLYRAIPPDIVQLSRYLGNAEIRRTYAGTFISGALIAWGFDEKVKDAAASMQMCSLYSYTDGVGLPLKLEFGPDILAPLLGHNESNYN